MSILTLAPACYEELRVFAFDEYSVLNIAPEWCYAPSDGVQGGAQESEAIEQPYEDLQAVAAALRLAIADAHGLAVRLSGDRSYLSLLRMRR